MDYDLIVVKTLERVYKNYYYIIRGINMKLAMGCDPAAYRFYKKLLERMKEEGYDIVDTGCESENEADGWKF